VVFNIYISLLLYIISAIDLSSASARFYRKPQSALHSVELTLILSDRRVQGLPFGVRECSTAALGRPRHAELVSASRIVKGETLKRPVKQVQGMVQGDKGVEQGDAKGLGIRDSLFGIRRCSTAALGRPRHAELVSASRIVKGETLKQVQGDKGVEHQGDKGVEQDDAKGLGIRDSLFGVRGCGTAALGCGSDAPLTGGTSAL